MKRNTKSLLFLSLVALAAVLGAMRIFSDPGPLVVTGVVEADEARVGSLVGGRVATVNVQEGDSVQKGDLLVELEPFDLRERQKEAEAKLHAAEAEHKLLEEGFRTEEREAAWASLEKARAQLEFAKKDFDRAQKLLKKSAISRQELDRAQSAFKAAQASVNEQLANYNRFEQGSRKREIERAAALEDASAAVVAGLQKQIEELGIRAPMDGTVHAVDLVEGDLIAAKAPVLSLLNLKKIWVRAYLPENALHYSIGQKVELRCDSFPGESFSGNISFLSSEAEFTPSNVQTQEDRSKQAYRIKIDMSDADSVLRPGMFCDVLLSNSGSE